MISGYYGFGNVGDEIILSCILKELEATVSRERITVLSKNPEETRGIHSVNAKSRWNVKEVVAAIRRSSIFVSGGGTLLQDITGFLSPYYYLSLLYLAQRFHKKTFIYAQGFGPLKHISTRRVCREILNRTDVITVRDRFSLKFLSQIGVEINSKKIYITADPAWTLYPYVEKKISAFPKIGVILRKAPYCTRFDVGFWYNLIYWLKKFLSKEIHAMVFCAADEKEFIYKNFGALDVDLYIETSITKIVEFIKTFDVILSTRLHGLILGLLSGAAVFGFGEDVKIHALLDEMGIAEISYCKIAEPRICAYRISKMYFEEWGKHSSAIGENISQQIARAKLTAKIFKSLLEQCM